MIFYNKERDAWDFSKINDDEKEAMLVMAERYWAQIMAQAMAKTWVQEEMEQNLAEAADTSVVN